MKTSRTEGEFNTQVTGFVIRGKRISRDTNGYLCLNDIWALSNERPTKSPRIWRGLPTTKDLIGAFSQNDKYFDAIAKNHEKSAIYSKSGKGGGTFAHVILALAYAEYLNPQLGIEVREIASRFWFGDLTLLNAGYRGLYNGLDESAIHRRKGLRKKQAILDHMAFDELAANMFRTSVAQQRLRKEPVQTVSDACDVHMRTGERVRDFLQESGLTMPEDMPVADSIVEAKRRLKFSGKGPESVKAVK